MEMIYLFSGVLAGLIISWLLYKFLLKQNFIHLTDYNALDKEHGLLEERHQILLKNSQELDQGYKNKVIENTGLEKKVVELQSEIFHLQEKLNFQKKEFENLHQVFTEKFEKIAGEVLHKNSQQFTRINHERLHLILDPLKEKINHFEKKVEETQQKQLVESSLLKKEIATLAELNQQMSIEANNLTQALKGDNKIQGNWGEVVLERVLERSGLVNGSEYFTQGQAMKLTGDQGQHLKPDVVVLLPDDKHIVVDSKVSLKAYEYFINSQDEQEKVSYLKQHVNSIKAHIRNLAEKYYQSIDKLNSPDFVLLFLPIEASFSTAIGHEGDDLFSFAWEKKVVIVSPTTLLATLKTVASIWKNEKQNKNAMKIAEESGKLYDKLFAFVGDLEKVGKSLKVGQDAYDEAMKKLGTGKGNLLDRADKLKKLGINTKKSIERPGSD
ncbi:DNA recombination protein RmuC [Fulvivirgaceae bacterium BMA12]|uniref:DNA recombination protein RmuC n=1 Tax=Agaribacillus aureus TaxID=3051825 RepID=A0ABT8LCT3_9BACT|nr:DNA recombination protein RmuC [Fulvivirgaceae bacterium BMA12]